MNNDSFLLNIGPQINDLQHRINQLEQKIELLKGSTDNQLHMLKQGHIDLLHKYLQKISYQVQGLIDALSPIIYNLSTMADNSTKFNPTTSNNMDTSIVTDYMEKLKELQVSFDNSEKKIDNLNTDYQSSKQYLDIIDDTLDTFEAALNNLNGENEAILTALIKIKSDFDNYVQSSVKEKILLTTVVSIMAHDLIINGIINAETYQYNFKKVLEEISSIYKKQGLDLDFSEELTSIDQEIYQKDRISLRIPQLGDIILSNDSDTNIISLTDLKKQAADAKKMKIKSGNKKNDSINTTLIKKDNIIDNVYERLQQLKNKRKNNSNSEGTKGDSNL